MVREYSVYMAKAKLSELLRFVKQNGCVVITERGVPIAQVTAIDHESGSLENRMRLLEKAGLLSQARGDISPDGPLAKRPGALKRFLAERE